MTPEQQRIAIAEWCGWKHSWRDRRRDYEYQHESDLPDYLNDLNAMHEVEKKLDANKVVNMRLTYGSNLFRIVCPGPSMSRQWETWVTLHATAAQRAEALLQTIGKWTP